MMTWDPKDSDARVRVRFQVGEPKTTLKPVRWDRLETRVYTNLNLRFLLIIAMNASLCILIAIAVLLELMGGELHRMWWMVLGGCLGWTFAQNGSWRREARRMVDPFRRLR